MTTVTRLEESLQHEMPAGVWHCEAANRSPVSAAAGPPVDIEVTVTLPGQSHRVGSFHISGGTLERLGPEETARFICAELAPLRSRIRPRYACDWDKLAD